MQAKQGITVVIFLLIFFLLLPFVFGHFWSPKTAPVILEKLPETAFFEQAAAGNIVSATETSSNNFMEFDGSLKNEHKFTALVDPNHPAYKESIQRIPQLGVAGPKVTSFWQALVDFILSLLPFVLLIGFFVLIGRKQRNFFSGFSQSKAHVADANEKSVTFADVAGVEEAKKEVREVVDFLRHPQRFSRLGAHVPHGVLLVGPPGCGKTLLARAVAGEAGVPFFSIGGSEFVELFVGTGASRIRDLFQKARQHPCAVVFIDELDAVGKMRHSVASFGSNDEREQTLGQLLKEMDGIGASGNIIVLAATNMPDVLDPALLRPGRFDRSVVVDRPDREGREAILRIHARQKVLKNMDDLKRLAQMTPGLCGADLANLINEAALAASQEGCDAIAYHEVGHALVAHVAGSPEQPVKISCIMRGLALGNTQLVPENDQYLLRKDQLLARMAVALGGRAAEEIFCGGGEEVTTGASNDIEKATQIAEAMVTRYGMGKQGVVDLALTQEHAYLGGSIPTRHARSQETLHAIEQEVRELTAHALSTARCILETNTEVVHKTVALLMEKETLDRDEFLPIFEKSSPAIM